jgi:flagellar basal body-associated protein FliL
LGQIGRETDQSPAKKEKPNMIWLRYAAAVIFLCGLGGILWMTNNKAEVNGDQQFASQSENEKSIPASVKKSENAEAVKSNPINPILDSDNQKFAVKNEDSSTRFTLNEVETPRMKNSISKEKLASNQIPDIKKEEPQIVSKPEEQLAHTDIQKPREKVKYVSSSDLLFGGNRQSQNWRHQNLQWESIR